MWKMKQICDNSVGAILGNVSAFPFMKRYTDNYIDYDRYIEKQYGFRRLDTDYEDLNDISQVIAEFKKDVAMTLKMNEYEFQKLYDTLDLQYDPISNYDKHSTITSVAKGVVNEKTGTESDTNTTNGNVENLEFLGAKNSTVSEQVRPWDSDAVNHDKSRQIYNDGNQNNETQTNYNNLNVSNNKTYNIKDTKDYMDTVTEHTNGNIGVTTSQQMIESERNVAEFNFYEIVFEKIFTMVSTIYLDW